MKLKSLAVAIPVELDAASFALSPCSYISKVDVLHILVAAAYRHMPSLDQILQPAAVTRLRNQLLEAEYYQLGVEVRQR